MFHFKHTHINTKQNKKKTQNKTKTKTKQKTKQQQQQEQQTEHKKHNILSCSQEGNLSKAHSSDNKMK